MRFLIAALVALWGALTVFAYFVVLPERDRGAEMLHAYLEATAIAEQAAAGQLDPQDTELAWSEQGISALSQSASAYRQLVQQRLGAAPPANLADIETLPDEQRERLLDILRDHFNQTHGFSVQDTPTLVWSTDDNPARAVQSRLFRVWHLLNYGEPVNVETDPSNRDITKAIVQCVAGKGPDLIETYGPEQLRQFVESGVALDLTEEASARNFGLDRVFDAAIPSMAVKDDNGNWRQYAFPCNVGYTVLFYHRDLFQDAGIPEPQGVWSIEQMVPIAQELKDHAASQGIARRFGIMNLGAWDMGTQAGGRFFNEQGTASYYNVPRTVEGLTAYHRMLYDWNVSPTPAEAASVASSGGANMNADADAASASSLFAAKVAAMYVGGRWEYVSLATRNRDRVIIPAIDRALAANTLTPETQALLRNARTTMMRDVLIPLDPAALAAINAALTEDDRDNLVNIGVTHIPTTLGAPTYNAGARVAVVNRSSDNVELAVRFLEFLGSEAYNEQINQTFDSICGVIQYTTDNDGISGPPQPLPGLDGMDSQVFVEAMRDYARAEQITPFLTRTRLGEVVSPVLEDLQNDAIGPSEAARIIERRINEQIAANLRRDNLLRQRWEAATGTTFNPDPDVSIPDMLEGTTHSRRAHIEQIENEIAERRQRAGLQPLTSDGDGA